MADPVISISAASSIGKNYATLNGSITPNATSQAWADGTSSDTEYFFEWLDADGNPLVATVDPDTVLTADDLFPASTGGDYVNVITYPPPTAHTKVSGSSPITITRVAYLLNEATVYYVRLCAWRILYPGAGAGDAFERAGQPYQLFTTGSITFTTL